MAERKNTSDEFKALFKRKVFPVDNKDNLNDNKEKINLNKDNKKNKRKIRKKDDFFLDSEVINDMNRFLKHEIKEKAMRGFDEDEVLGANDSEVEENNCKDKKYAGDDSFVVERKEINKQEAIGSSTSDVTIIESTNTTPFLDETKQKKVGKAEKNGDKAKVKKQYKDENDENVNPQNSLLCQFCGKNCYTKKYVIKGNSLILCVSCFKTVQESNCARCNKDFTGKTYVNQSNNSRICRVCYGKMKRMDLS